MHNSYLTRTVSQILSVEKKKKNMSLLKLFHLKIEGVNFKNLSPLLTEDSGSAGGQLFSDN